MLLHMEPGGHCLPLLQARKAADLAAAASRSLLACGAAHGACWPVLLPMDPRFRCFCCCRPTRLRTSSGGASAWVDPFSCTMRHEWTTSEALQVGVAVCGLPHRSALQIGVAAAVRGVQQAVTPGAGSCMLGAVQVRSCTLKWGRLALCTVNSMMSVCGKGSKAAAADLPGQKAHQT